MGIKVSKIKRPSLKGRSTKQHRVWNDKVLDTEIAVLRLSLVRLRMSDEPVDELFAFTG